MKKYLRWILIALGIFILIGIIAVASGGDEKPKTEVSKKETTPVEPEPDSIAAAKLYQEYEANEIAADKKYKGKKMRISGKVESIGKDVLNEPYITLYAGDAAFHVQCYLNDGAQAEILKKGDTIVLDGEVSGLSVLNVLVKDCVIQK